jgi:hypothetical protein
MINKKMHKTIYIEADEEITSVIDRVKKEGSPDIFIVVPKNAMLVQGVINLKLLKKESAKMKKNVILVTNDKQAKKVISRIGFEIKEVLSPEEIEEVSQEEEFDEVEKTSLDSIEELENQERKAVGQREIGSESFFTDEKHDEFFDENENEDILDNSDIKNIPTASEKVIKRMDMTKNSADVNIVVEEDAVMDLEPQSLVSRKLKNGVMMTTKRKKEVQEIFEEDIDFDGEEFQAGFSDQKAEEFFTQKDDKREFSKKSFKKNKPVKKKASRKSSYFFVVGLIIVLALIGFGGWVYFNWPQMNIVIYPNEKSVASVSDVDILTDLAVSNIEDGQLTGRMEEFEIEKTLDFDATGEKYSSDQGKARGKVTIYNKYSSADQPLVKTTRVLSKEGKLFRLIDSVTVPGMEGETLGKIEVKVIADQPGIDFNIESSIFTIEGFKGNPKYEMFEVVSEESISGGSDASGNSLVKYITESDIEKARTATLESLDKSFEEEMKGRLDESREYVLDSAKKEVVENESSFDIDDIADKFNYTIKQKVRLMTFASNDLMEFANIVLSKELDSGYELDENKITTEIIKDITDFEKKSMSLRVNFFGIAWPGIDQENFKKGIADQKEEAFGNVLKNYQEIKKVDIEYIPGWLSGVAVSENKIHIDEKQVILDE